MNRVELARSLYDVISRTRGVARLHSGPVELSTQYPGGKVPGIVLAATHVEAHLVLDELPVTTIAARVHKAGARVLREAGDPRELRVVVTDVDVDTLESNPRR